MKKRKKKIQPQPPSPDWVTDFDRHLIAQGTHERSYEKMGSHFVTVNGEKGVHFAVWAPNARQISLIGDFNNWNSASHPMDPSDSGIWTIFMPDLPEHSIYKYRITTHDESSFDKVDPYGFAMEERPRTGTVVVDLDRYQWNDTDWIGRRAETQSLDRPISIYELHPGSWRKIVDKKWGLRYLTYRELADQLIPY
ncbi:MAG: 1,4-alpha-glucan branching enzyme, partial [Desulfobulbaceae bacterium]|nr:1,4-alpha-glucan branching enzyme [Desulfobulbaceae bacterium]